MLKSVADRLAEGFAECLHARVRRDLWGYALDETFSNEEIIAEKYQGILPAPGYPACPEHVVKKAMFTSLECADIDMQLTDSSAMYAAQRVTSFYPSHTASKCFHMGTICQHSTK